MIALVIGLIVLAALGVGAVVLVTRSHARPRDLVVVDDVPMTGNVRILRDADEVREAARQACERERELVQYSQRRADRFECIAYRPEPTDAPPVVGKIVKSKVSPPLNV